MVNIMIYDILYNYQQLTNEFHTKIIIEDSYKI